MDEGSQQIRRSENMFPNNDYHSSEK
jgi:hypothetical protein